MGVRVPLSVLKNLMTFLNPILLFGLIASAIPIALHILNLKKLKTIEFSTIRFLKELESKQIRKIEIKQWLLLIIRTLLIIFLVFVFSRPVLKSNFFDSINSNTSSIIIFDDSKSMTRLNSDGVFLEQSKTIAKEYLNDIKPNDKILITTLSELKNNKIGIFVDDKNILLKKIESIKPSYSYFTISEALSLTNNIFTQSINVNEEILILTDNQKSNFINNNFSGIDENIYSEKTKIFYSALNTENNSNVGIDTITILSPILKANSIVKLNVRLFNNSNNANKIISLFINNKRVSQKEVSFQNSGFKTIPINFYNETTGLLNGRVEIEDDEIVADNKFYFSISIPNQIKVAVLTSDVKSETFLKASLETLAKIDTLGLINYQFVKNINLISNFDAVIISNLKSINANESETINNYLKNGGAVLFFPTNDNILNDLSSGVLRNLGKIKIESFVEPIYISKTDLAHQIFDGMFENNSKFESPKINKIASFENETKAREIIQLSNGKSFLSEIKIGKGRFIFCSVGLNLEFSDMPVKGFYIPLLSQMLLFSTTNLISPIKTEIGKEMILALNDFKIGSGIKITDKNNIAMEVKFFKNNLNNELKTNIVLPEITEPGNYFLNNNLDEIILSFNLANEEIDLKEIEFDEVKNIFSKSGIKAENIFYIENGKELKAKINSARIGSELWPFLLLICLALAILEMFISKTNKNEIE